MVEDLIKLNNILNDKIKPIVDAIENADATTEEYGKLLDNFNATITISSNLNRTLTNLEQAINKAKVEEKEEEK